jgi:hypothetical protein
VPRADRTVRKNEAGPLSPDERDREFRLDVAAPLREVTLSGAGPSASTPLGTVILSLMIDATHIHIHMSLQR